MEVEAAARWVRRNRTKKTCATPLFDSLWPQPYLDIDGGGGCCPVGEEEQTKEDLSTPLFDSLWPQPYLDIDGGGGCGPAGEEEYNKEDLSYTSLRFSLVLTLPGYRRRWRLLPGG
jgi:hypothetical protein